MEENLYIQINEATHNWRRSFNQEWFYMTDLTLVTSFVDEQG